MVVRSALRALAVALGLVLTGGVLVVPPASAAVFVSDTPSPTWGVDGPVYATAIVGDTVFVGGQFSNATGPAGASAPRKNLAAFSLATGALLTGWRADATSIVRSLASDGTALYVGGSFPQIGGVARARLAKLSVLTGQVDPSFKPTIDSTVRVIELDGANLFIGGGFTSVNGTVRNRLAKLDAGSGSLVTSFNAPASHQVYGLALDPVRRTLYAGGQFNVLSGAARSGVGAVNADTGAIRPTVFTSAARPTLGLDLDENGDRLFGAGGGSTNAAAAWDTTSGTRVWRQVANGDIQAVRYFGGSVYFGFHDGFQNDTTIKLLAADARTGTVDPSFRPVITSFWGIWSLDVSDEGLVAGGDFTTVSGVPAHNVAMFPRTGSLPPPPPVEDPYVGSATPWHHWDQGTRPDGWETPEFDDSAWPTGTTQLGYGDGDESTVIGYGPSASNKYLASYFRARFEIGSLADSVRLLLAADDGAVVYVNGVEAARDNMPAGTVGNTTRASSGRSGGPENELRPFDLDPALFHLGTNVVAVEVHQDGPSSSDLSFDADLTGTTVPAANVPPTADFTTSMTGQTVLFDGSPSSDPEGPVAGYEWNFGDGVTATGPTPTHTYAAVGDYTVTLRVADNGGAHTTLVRTVSVLSELVETTLVAAGADWAWTYPTLAPAAGWQTPSFDDSTWSVGAATLGFGTAVATNINGYATTAERPRAAYFRRAFAVGDLDRAAALQLRTVANDGVVIYVNGVEVARSNMPAGAVGHATYALTSRSAATASASPVVVDVPLDLLVPGTNVVTAETHLNYRGTADVSFQLTATLSSRR